MVETGGRNPPFPPNFVTSKQLPDDRSSTEGKPDNRPLLPPNYVSLRQLRERRLREEQEREKRQERGKISDDVDQLHPNYITARQLEEQLLKEAKEKVKGKEKEEKEMKGNGDGREEESGDRPLLPPNYISLKQLQAPRLKKERRNGDRGEEKVKEGKKEKAPKEEEEKGGNCPSNFVSLRQLKELRLQEKDQKGAKEKARFQQTKVQEEGDESGKIEKNINNYRARNLHSEKTDMKPRRAWAPVLSPAGTSSGTGISLADAMFLPENAGVSCNVVMPSPNQNGDDAVMKPKNKGNCKYKKKKNRKTTDDKKKDEQVKGSECSLEVTDLKNGKAANASSSTAKEVALSQHENNAIRTVKGEKANLPSPDQNGDDAVMKPRNKGNCKYKKKKNRKTTDDKKKDEQVKGPECSIEVTDLKNGEAANASSSAAKEVALSQHENNAVRTVKGEKANLAESSSPSIPISVEVKRFNGAPSRKFKTHKRRDNMKAKEVKLSEPVTNVISMGEVVKGCDGLKEVTGTKIENSKKQKGKGKMVNIAESIDQILSHEEAKEVNGAGDLIGSEIGSCEVKGRSRNVDLSELSQMGGQPGDQWRKRNQAAGRRGRGHPRAGRLPVRPAEHLSGGGSLVWVPKNNS